MDDREYYLDTSIWIDFYEKRGKHGEIALHLILKIIADKNKIAYSDLTIKELKRFGYTNDQINAMFSIAKSDNMRHTHIHREQIDEAKRIGKQKHIPVGDALHAILARDNNVQLISRDQHFDRLKHITEVKKPEDIS